MRAVTWNEKNNPDLPRAQVRHDARYAASLKFDLYAFQELGEKQDHEDFKAVMPDRTFFWLTPNRAISLALRRSVFSVHKSGYVLCHKGIGGVTPNRGFGWALVTYKGVPEKFCVIYTHTVSAAWSERRVKMKAKRKQLWNLHWSKMLSFAEDMRAEGYSVILLGDLNRVDLPKLLPGWRSLAHHGLDHILWAPGRRGGPKIKPKSLTRGAIHKFLYTDHLPVWARFTLT
jgi:hypothetical protein